MKLERTHNGYWYDLNLPLSATAARRSEVSAGGSINGMLLTFALSPLLLVGHSEIRDTDVTGVRLW